MFVGSYLDRGTASQLPFSTLFGWHNTMTRRSLSGKRDLVRVVSRAELLIAYTHTVCTIHHLKLCVSWDSSMSHTLVYINRADAVPRQSLHALNHDVYARKEGSFPINNIGSLDTTSTAT